jgi:mannitol-1-phosphate 5-dehydrogenase
VKLVQFGAGNIGRSFLGQVFSRAGWELVFIDIDEKITALLNEKKYYTVVIKRDGREDERRRIGPVRALSGGTAAVLEIAGADIVSTSVGKNALAMVLPLIARGLEERRKIFPYRPLDIIIAENAREAPLLMRTILAGELGASYPLERLVGIVETSIGKMVPIMRREDLASDPLLLFAEAYETLIVDKRGFKGPIPAIEALRPVEPIEAYVDRKLFIHNLGHAAAAYLGYRALTRRGGTSPSAASGVPAFSGGADLTIPEALALPGVEDGVQKAMNESVEALLREYPGVFSRDDLSRHIEDLLGRFKNTALGDTVHRVGRDLRRKLGREDRLTGAMLLCAKHGLPFTAIAEVYRAALDFAAPGGDGALFPPDAEFRKEYALDQAAADPAASPVLPVLLEVSGLKREDPADFPVYSALAQSR